MELGTEAALLSLPVELVVQIAKELDPVSLRRLGRSCRSLNNVLEAHSESLEHDILRLAFNIDYSSADTLIRPITLQTTILLYTFYENLTISDTKVNCGQISLDGKIALDLELLSRSGAGKFRHFDFINLFEAIDTSVEQAFPSIDAKVLSDLKHLLASSAHIRFHNCTISTFPDYRMCFFEYWDCVFSKDLHIPTTFSVVYFGMLNSPPQPRKFCDKILTKLLALEDCKTIGSDIFTVRKFRTMHELRKRSPRLEILSFAIGDNLVYYAAGLASESSNFYCPSLYFGGSPLTSLGLRKYIKRLLSGPSHSHDSFFTLQLSNFYRQHLLENSFEVALRLPREQLIPGAYEKETFIFEKDNVYDVVAEARLGGEMVDVTVFLSER